MASMASTLRPLSQVAHASSILWCDTHHCLKGELKTDIIISIRTSAWTRICSFHPNSAGWLTFPCMGLSFVRWAWTRHCLHQSCIPGFWARGMPNWSPRFILLSSWLEDLAFHRYRFLQRKQVRVSNMLTIFLRALFCLLRPSVTSSW